MAVDDIVFSSSFGEKGKAIDPHSESAAKHHGHLHYHEAKALFKKRKSSSRRRSARRSSLILERTTTGTRWWKFTLRAWDDEEDQDWWFASTAIPLLAATIGPLANVLSIAALVTSWRMCLVTGVGKDDAAQCSYDGNKLSLGPELDGQTFDDPRWCYYLNVASLIVGFVGNFFLLCNFTGRIRYIIALPVTIILWYIATGILLAITVSMHVYVPPTSPQQTYTQGFWYAVIATCMYATCSMLLMINMLGYFLGHYPQHFTLTESQQTLILQTMLFFFWLAGGAAAFSAVERRYGDGGQKWGYVNALYFCDVTILTVGFGDLYPTNNIARGINFPYSVGGIIMLGLMASSISKFAGELGSEKIIHKHVEHSRAKTVGRTVTTSLELERRQTFREGERPTISGPMDPVTRTRTPAIDFADVKRSPTEPPIVMGPLKRVTTLASMVTQPRSRAPKLLLLREEKDRFDAMRRIQMDTNKFKRWYALCLSITAFALLWCGGALIFWRCERLAQGLTYFEALYFCYVSLLTIGYGDLAPISNAGRPFFVLWSLIAVPTMAILVSDLGDTVIKEFKQGTAALADFTVLPKAGIWREYLEKHPKVWDWLKQRKQDRDAKHRIEEGFQVGPDADELMPVPTIEELAKDEPSREVLARRLANKIKETAHVMKAEPDKRYNYEEWVEVTELIRFTAKNQHNGEMNGVEEEGLIEWDWIGEDSPMMSRSSEAEFVLDRLCESMNRYIKTAVTSHSLEGESSVKRSPDERRWTADDDSAETEEDGLGKIKRTSIDGVDPLDTRVRGRNVEKDQG